MSEVEIELNWGFSVNRELGRVRLIDHALSEGKQSMDWFQFLARERLKERLSPSLYKGIH